MGRWEVSKSTDPILFKETTTCAHATALEVQDSKSQRILNAEVEGHIGDSGMLGKGNSSRRVSGGPEYQSP